MTVKKIWDILSIPLPLRRGKPDRHLIEALSVHSDAMVGRWEEPTTSPPPLSSMLSESEQRQLDPLLELAEQLYQSMTPVQPSVDFVRALEQDLVGSARERMMAAKRVRQVVLIVLAAVGSFLSAAFLIGIAIFVLLRLRDRVRANTLQSMTG